MDQKRDRPYSFVYYGQHGTLDYAFASKALAQRVQQAFIWNVNADFPANIELPEPWLRFSDHDPVVVDFSLRHSNTSD
jgi:predicted extracellular nuclease